MLFRRTAGGDSNNCQSCHNVPVIGAAGDFTANAFISEGFESFDFETLDPQFSNERGSPSLFGAGLIELLGREMTAELRAERDTAVAEARKTGKPVTVALTTKGVDFGKVTVMPDGLVDNTGIEGVDPDLTVRPFSQKGVFASLRQFTINAGNLHLGLEADERWGARWTGTPISTATRSPTNYRRATSPRWSPSRRRCRRRAAWCRTMPTGSAAGASRANRYSPSLGCSSCHMAVAAAEQPRLHRPRALRHGRHAASGRGRQGAESTTSACSQWAKTLPRNDQGQILVPLFGDLKRHKIADPEVNGLGNELLSQRFVERDVFMTSELWGVGSTAPYGHRNDFTTLDSVIRAHGGEARSGARRLHRRQTMTTDRT